MSFRSLFSALVLSVPFFAIACSSGGSASGSVSVPESTKLTALSDADRADLCDWSAAQYGGYGKEKSCDGASGGAGYESQKACTDQIKSYPSSCDATVGDFEKLTKTLSECKDQGGSAEVLTKITACALGGLGNTSSNMGNIDVNIPGH